MKKLKYVKLFEMFNPQFGYGRSNRPEGYSGDEWYKKMREYEKYISSVKQQAQDWIANPEEVFSEEFLSNQVRHASFVKDGNTSGGLNVLKPDSRAMIYFDNLDEEKEKEIIEKAKEIKEYTKIGHDPAWINDMNKRLRELSHQMFAFREPGTYRENKWGSKFYNKEKETWIPYEYKKPILKERPF